MSKQKSDQCDEGVIVRQLQERVTALVEECRHKAARCDELYAATQKLGASEKEARAQFADLKQRLQAAETSNQFMRGYLARVQEDDAVREELVVIGEPGGEQLAPKREPAQFLRPDDFMAPDQDRSHGLMGYEDHGCLRAKRRPRKKARRRK